MAGRVARTIFTRYNLCQFGAWRSPASALAWGARGPGFKSQRPDWRLRDFFDGGVFHIQTSMIFDRIRQLEYWLEKLLLISYFRSRYNIYNPLNKVKKKPANVI
jgi:hypothetical protein